jgi:uncharacterized protein (TIGR02594 family)
MKRVENRVEIFTKRSTLMFKVIVLADMLHLRAEATKESSSLGMISRASELLVSQLSDEGTWLRVVDAEGRKGWCSAQYLMPKTDLHAPWLEAAVQEIGVKEQPDEASPPQHPRILEYLASVDDLSKAHMSRDETAWCSCFVNWCMAKVGLFGTNSATAQSWHTQQWRNQVAPQEGRAGDLIVFRSGGADSSSGHVGFFIALDSTNQRVWMLGGNQSNAVRYSVYPLSGMLGETHFTALSCRRP